MKKVLAVIMILMFGLLIIGCGKAKEGAAGFGEKTYSATMLTSAEGMAQQMAGKMYHDGDKMRTETNAGGFNMIHIVRKDKKVIWTIIPQNKAYVEEPLTESQAQKGELTASGKMVKVGDETMDGHPCVKYEVTTTEQPDAKTFEWLAKDLRNFPIRMEHVVKGASKSVTQFKDISFDKPAADLFEIPAGFKKVSSVSEAMMGGKVPAYPKAPRGPRPPKRRG